MGIAFNHDGRLMEKLREPVLFRIHDRTGRAAERLTGTLVRRSGPGGLVTLWLDRAGVDVQRFS
jgi:hypothetical protein